MSAQEILIEETKRQPEPVLREVLHYLKFHIPITRQNRGTELEVPLGHLPFLDPGDGIGREGRRPANPAGVALH